MKKTICAMLAFALLFGISGCGKDSGEASAPEQETTTAEMTETPPQESQEATNANEPIVFADAAFESGVREQLGKTEGDITIGEAAAVTELNLELPGDDWSIPRISDLSDLKYFPNLTSLNLNWGLSKSGGVDLSPVAGLTKLESLAFACTSIKGIEPLAGLTNLKDLQAWGTRTITDISPLANLTQLERVWISNNLISDLSPLSGLEKLSYLAVDDNIVSDVSPIAGLTNLKHLQISDNPIKDYTPLSNIFQNLEEKDFELLDHSVPITFTDAVLENKVREAINLPEGDITPEMAESVTELCLGNEWQEVIPEDVKIQSISTLKYFPNLFKLELQFNNLNDNTSYLSVLAVMPNLTILDLNGNSLFDYNCLAVCKNLSWLNISGNYGSDLSPLSEMANLSTLYISYSPEIKDISPLAALTNLETLYMENVSIEDYSPLSNLTKLKTLYINQSEGGEQDLSPLSGIYENLTDKNFEID